MNIHIHSGLKISDYIHSFAYTNAYMILSSCLTFSLSYTRVHTYLYVHVYVYECIIVCLRVCIHMQIHIRPVYKCALGLLNKHINACNDRNSYIYISICARRQMLRYLYIFVHVHMYNAHGTDLCASGITLYSDTHIHAHRASSRNATNISGILEIFARVQVHLRLHLRLCMPRTRKTIPKTKFACRPATV